ncbi:MAG: amidohydrolase family protein [Opitutales bacterium]
MIDTPIIDPHLHLWDLDRIEYPWLSQVPIINRSFGLADYDEAREGVEVEAMVFVECDCARGHHMDEFAWVQEQADADPQLKGIVPHLPLENGEAIAGDIAQIAADPRTKGVRRLLFNQPDDLCTRPGFIRGVQLLGQAGLHFELTNLPAQFPQVRKLVEAAPDTRFILDHIGNPDIAGGQMQPWKDHLKSFAESSPHPCKFSNFVCNADLENWTVEDLKPYADAVIEAFTPDRLIWAGDWPHVLRASSWKRWLDAADQLTAHLSPADRRKIFHDNAREFYRLK